MVKPPLFVMGSRGRVCLQLALFGAKEIGLSRPPLLFFIHSVGFFKSFGSFLRTLQDHEQEQARRIREVRFRNEEFDVLACRFIRCLFPGG